MSSVLARVQSLLQEHFSLTPAQTAPEQILTELGIESLDALEFIFKLEDEFNVSLTEERPVFTTVGDIVSTMERVLAGRHSGT
jgi:acyl carrier protein